MRKSLLAAAVAVVFLLPAFADSEAQNSQPYNVTAEAGRTYPGNRWCECEEQDCVCDPDQRLTVQPDAAQESDPVNLGATFSFVVGAAVLVLRLRQLL